MKGSKMKRASHTRKNRQQNKKSYFQWKMGKRRREIQQKKNSYNKRTDVIILKDKVWKYIKTSPHLQLSEMFIVHKIMFIIHIFSLTARNRLKWN